MIYKIYTLTCPIDNEVKYIGCSRDVEVRYKAHLCVGWANKKMKPWITQLKERGLKPILGIYSETDDYETAIRMEIEAYNNLFSENLLCANPAQNHYKDCNAHNAIEAYYKSKVFKTIFKSRIKKTKAYNALSEHRKELVLNEITYIARLTDRHRITKLQMLERACIDEKYKGIVRDLLTNNLIN